MAVRDLREEVRQRLQLILAERGQLQQRLQFLEESEKQLKQLLAFEEMRIRYEQTNMAFPFVAPDKQNVEADRSTLALFLKDCLLDGQSHSLGDLKAKAEDAGIEFEGKHPGRVLHFALLGMSQGGSVEMVKKGVWRMRGEARK